MTERLILLPGWGLGSLPLDVLAEALRGLDPALRVEIEPLPAPTSHSTSPGRGARAERVIARISRLVSMPSCM